jgi:hypothetical protein
MAMELGPDILMMLMPPVPGGDAMAAMVESNIKVDIYPPEILVQFSGKDELPNHPNFF